MKLWSKAKTEETNTEVKETGKSKKSIGNIGKKVMMFVKRHKILTVLLVLFLCVLAAFLFIRGKKKQRGAMEQMQQVIETTTVEKMDLSNSISVTGTIASADRRIGTTTLSNLEVETVYVEVGDVVEKGDIICVFDSSDIKEALATAKNNYSVNQSLENLEGDYTVQYTEALEEAESTLQKARDTRDAYKEAYKDAAEEEEEAEEALDAATKALNEGGYETAFQTAEAEAKAAFAGYRGVNPEDISNLDTQLETIKDENNGIIPSDLTAAVTAYETAKTAYEEAKKAVTAAQSKYDKAKAATTSACEAYERYQDAREDAQEVYEDTVEKATDTYEKAKLQAQLISEDGEKEKIESYEEQLEDCVVYAPMSGVITALSVEAGEKFGGGTIYEMQDPNHFVVEASVDEYDIVELAKGMSAYVKTDSMGDVEMEAELTFVSPTGTSGMQMGSASGTASYEIEITIKEPQERLRSGMTAQVSISLEESKEALAVPYDCVQTNMRGESVIYVDDNGERREVVVETGLETDYYTEIISDEIREGMTVYLGTQMIQGGTMPDFEEMDENMPFNMGTMPGGMPGGSMPSGGGRPSGMPAGGGMPSGGPGGF